MYPHRIRLRGPWEQDTPDGPRRVNLPGPFPEGRFPLRRRFGYPGRIDAYERVWLVVAGLTRPADVSLNGTPLAGFAGEADVTHLLRPRNELAIVTDAGWEEAALEVRATAYLRDVVMADGRVTGRVAGEAPMALDLYLLAGRGTASYISIRPAPEGTPFALEAGQAEGPFRVELVCGAAVWWVEPLG